MPAVLVHVGGEEPPGRHGLADRVRLAALAPDDHLERHARHRRHVALELVAQERQVLARGQHDLLRDVVVPRQRVHLGAVRAGALHLAADEHVPLEPVVGVERGVHRLPEDGPREVARVLEVQQVLVGVVVGRDVGPEGAHDVGRGVPGVRVGPPDLRVPEVLVVGQDVREGGRHGGAQHRVDRHVVGGGRGGVDAHVLLLDVPRGGQHPVHHQPGVVVVPPGLLPLPVVPVLSVPLLGGAHLGVPVEGAPGQDLGHLVARPQLPQPPRHEPEHHHRPQRLLEERDVVHVQVLTEPRGALGAAHAAIDPLRQAGGLDDLEALLERGLGRPQLQQQRLALRDVRRPVVVAHAHQPAVGEVRVHRAVVRPG